MLENPCAASPVYLVDGLETSKQDSVQPTNVFVVGGGYVTAPEWVPRKGWSVHSKGYIIYTSRKKDSIKRGTRLHRFVMERVLGRPLVEGEHVHHMDFHKTNNCYCNLLLLPCEFNPSCALRDPYTGQFMSISEYQRRYGLKGHFLSGVPDWVTEFNHGDEDE